MSEDELAAFYASGYRSLVQGSEEATEKDLRIQAGRARHLVKFCQGVIKDIGAHLDIGSSSGALITSFKKAYGCESVGVEPGDTYRQMCLKRGMEVYTDLTHVDVKHQGTFDLVSMAHVLEHLPDPFSYLCRLRQTWIKPSGYLLIEVPNFYGHQSYEISHLTAFTPATLRQMLKAARFRLIKMSIHGRPRSPILPLYITALAEAVGDGFDRSTIRTNTGLVRWRRRLGCWYTRTMTARFPRWTWRELPELESDLE
jgi:SAM-dependent methyltransferase